MVTTTLYTENGEKESGYKVHNKLTIIINNKLSSNYFNLTIGSTLPQTFFWRMLV